MSKKTTTQKTFRTNLAETVKALTNEGYSTGGSGVLTGMRVGKAMKKGTTRTGRPKAGGKSFGDMEDQSERIASKIAKRKGKEGDRFPESKKQKKRNAEQFKGARDATSGAFEESTVKEGLSTGKNPIATGKRVGKFLLAKKKAKKSKDPYRGKPTSDEVRDAKRTNSIKDRIANRDTGSNKSDAVNFEFHAANSQGQSTGTKRTRLPANEGRKDGTPTQRAFAVGMRLADREHKDPDTRPENKKKAKRVEKVKGGNSVNAGKGKRFKELRGEKTY